MASSWCFYGEEQRIFHRYVSISEQAQKHRAQIGTHHPIGYFVVVPIHVPSLSLLWYMQINCIFSGQFDNKVHPTILWHTRLSMVCRKKETKIFVLFQKFVVYITMWKTLWKMWKTLNYERFVNTTSVFWQLYVTTFLGKTTICVGKWQESDSEQGNAWTSYIRVIQWRILKCTQILPVRRDYGSK